MEGSPVAEHISRDSDDDPSSQSIIDGVFERPPQEEFDESGLPEEIPAFAEELSGMIIIDAMLDASRVSDDGDEKDAEISTPFLDELADQEDGSAPEAEGVNRLAGVEEQDLQEDNDTSAILPSETAGDAHAGSVECMTPHSIEEAQTETLHRNRAQVTDGGPGNNVQDNLPAALIQRRTSGGEQLQTSVPAESKSTNAVVHIEYPADDECCRFEYIGQATQDRICHGKGVLWWTDGTTYMGCWKHEKPHGWGIQTYTDGSFFKGNFVNDARSGPGMFCRPDGTSYGGTWSNGDLVGLGFVLHMAGDEQKSFAAITASRGKVARVSAVNAVEMQQVSQQVAKAMAEAESCAEEARILAMSNKRAQVITDRQLIEPVATQPAPSLSNVRTSTDPSDSTITVRPHRRASTVDDEELAEVVDAAGVAAAATVPVDGAPEQQVQEDLMECSIAAFEFGEDRDRVPSLPNFKDQSKADDDEHGREISPFADRVTSPVSDRVSSPSSDGDRLPPLNSRRGSSRPVTSFIDAELAEVVAARTQRTLQDVPAAETMSFEDPPRRNKKEKMLRPIKARQHKDTVIAPDGKFTRVWLTEEEMVQLEKEAETLRKELQLLDMGRARRRATKRSATSLGFVPRGTDKAHDDRSAALPRMKQIGATTFAHAVGRRQDKARMADSRAVRQESVPIEEEMSERHAATWTHPDPPPNEDETLIATLPGDGTVCLSFAPDTDQFVAPQVGPSVHRAVCDAGMEQETAQPPPAVSAATNSSGSEGQGAKSSQRLSLAVESLSLLQRTPLSLFNRHWIASKGSDILMEYLDKEVWRMCRARSEFESELGARRDRKAKEEQRQSELDTQKAIRAYKRAERQFALHADLLKETAENQARLEAADQHAMEAKDAYHVLHERLKWKDNLNLKEEAELGHLRQEMESAEQQLEKEAINYELQLHRAFVEKAKNEQEMLRGQKARRQASIHEQVIKAADMDFFVSGGEGDEADALFMSNRLRGAAVQHARRHARDFVVALYQCTMALQAIGDIPSGSFLVGDALDYAGQLGEGGKAHGLGVETGRGGVFHYEGQWQNDQRHGLGALEHTRMRVVYEGMWWEGKRHGYGVEVHYLSSAADRLPVAFVEYDHGVRVGCKRFDSTRSVEPVLLESVRRVCQQARAAAEEGRRSHHVQVSQEEGDESGDEGNHKGPPHQDAGKANGSKRKEWKRLEQRRQEKERKRQDLKLQQKELRDIEGGVEAALKDLQVSTNEGFSAVSATLGKVGLKSSRLYSMTEMEKKNERPPVPPPSEHTMRNFLQKKGVPEVLAQRIVTVYFRNFDGQAVETVDSRSKERELLFDLAAGNGAAWHTFDSEKRLTSIRKRRGDANRDLHHARDKMKAAFSLPGVARAALSLPVNAKAAGRRAPSIINENDLPKLQVLSSKENIQDAMNALMNGNENAPVVITVPVDMPLDAAVQAFSKDKYDYILVRPGTYKVAAPIEVTKEIHIVGELGARLVGSWIFKAMDTTSTIHNVAMHFEGDVNASDYQRMLHVECGEIHITDSALLSPRGYCLWSSMRSAVSAKGCIFTGSEDGSVRALAGVVSMDFSRCSVVDSRMENHEESCVFADNDADMQLTNCVMQCADIGVMLTDRARGTLKSCTMRMFRRGCFGQMRSSETELSLRENTTHGELWGLGEKPARYIKFGNKHLAEFQHPDAAE